LQQALTQQLQLSLVLLLLVVTVQFPPAPCLQVPHHEALLQSMLRQEFEAGMTLAGFRLHVRRNKLPVDSMQRSM
jgi:hypothetical protein